MAIWNDFMIGLRSYSKAIRFIREERLMRFYLTPILLNVLLFSLGFSLVGQFSSEAVDAFEAWANPGDWEFWGASFFAGTIGFLVWLFFKLFFFLLFAFLGGYLVLILLSPLLAYLSELTEKKVLGTDYPFSFSRLVSDSIRGILIAIRNFAFELLAIVLLFLLSFIPVVGLISSPLLFLVSAYFYGFSFLDYTSERRRMKLKESVFYIRRNKGLAIANGAPFALALLVPVVGLSISGFLAIISTVAATLSILEKEKKSKTISA